MAKRFHVTLNKELMPEGLDLYVGQVWMTEGLSNYRKILSISNRKDSLLHIAYRDTSSEVESQDCDINDFVIWVLQSKAEPLLVDYSEYSEIET